MDCAQPRNVSINASRGEGPKVRNFLYLRRHFVDPEEMEGWGSVKGMTLPLARKTVFLRDSREGREVGENKTI